MRSLSPGGALGGPGEEVSPPQKNLLLRITTQGTPMPPNFSGVVESLVRSLCQVSARGVAWVGLGSSVRCSMGIQQCQGLTPPPGGLRLKECVVGEIC